jgi:hypothetical protein
MSKYQNTEVGGSRVRTNRIIINLPVGRVPEVRFIEEVVAKLLDSEIQVGAGRDISFKYDQNKSFQLRNPLTDELIDGKTSNYDEVFALFYSLIRAVQCEKDDEK